MSSIRARSTLSMTGQVNRPIYLFLFFRMIVATLIVGAGIIIIQITNETFPVRPLYILLAVSYLTGGLLYVTNRIGINPLFALWTLMVADLFLETAIIHYSGGTAGQFSMIFCLTIVAAAILYQVGGGLGTALIASSIYVAYGILEGSHVFSHPVETYGFKSAGPSILESYMHVSIFLLVGGVGGYMAGRIKIKGRLLENAETRLNQLRVDTKNILENMSSGLIAIDSDGKIVSINPMAEDILEIRKEEALSKYLSEVFATSMPELAFELSHSLRTERAKSRLEVTIRNSENKNVPLGISISLLKDGEGNKRGVIAVFQDLTEVREMQEHVRKSDRLAAIGELSAGIAHELRNPLASISGSIEMLYNEVDLTGENKRLMELVMRESDRLDRIISDFLEYAKMRPPAMKDFTLLNTVDEVLLLIGNNLIVSREINIEMVNRIGALKVKGDEEQMRQVFLNLAVNACEAMDGKGDLTISMERHKTKWVKIAFIDEGPGVGIEDRERLFEPFFTTKDGGTGLGLAIANKIVEAHGGRISFENREIGGAIFSVLLPVEKRGVVDEMQEEYEIEMAECIT